ncbi:MAG: hypothetical protein KKA25_14570 [Alphaproteobacteria bacterium]|nr:hypothetical protein [Alphaproteobacteria bacterium]
MAEAFLREARVYVCAQSMTTAGIWIWSEPFAAFDADDRDGIALGVRQALAASRSRVHHPHPDWQGVTAPMLKLADVRSFKAFAKGARCVGILLVDDRITFTPTRNGGPKEGFVGLGDKGRAVAFAEADIADELQRAFADSDDGVAA